MGECVEEVERVVVVEVVVGGFGVYKVCWKRRGGGEVCGEIAKGAGWTGGGSGQMCRPY